MTALSTADIVDIQTESPIVFDGVIIEPPPDDSFMDPRRVLLPAALRPGATGDLPPLVGVRGRPVTAPLPRGLRHRDHRLRAGDGRARPRRQAARVRERVPPPSQHPGGGHGKLRALRGVPLPRLGLPSRRALGGDPPSGRLRRARGPRHPQPARSEGGRLGAVRVRQRVRRRATPAGVAAPGPPAARLAQPRGRDEGLRARRRGPGELEGDDGQRLLRLPPRVRP